jgi:hypothetical protein
MGCLCCRTFREEYLPCQGVSFLGLPHTKTSPREGSREPRLTRTRAGFLFNHPSHRRHTEAVGSSTQIR